MYGWRGRVGSISATPTEALPYEFYKIVPDGVALVQTTVYIHEVTADNIFAAENLFDRIALDVAKEGVDVLILGASPATYLKGHGYDKVLSARIAELIGVPTVSNQTAAVEALSALGAKRIVVASPNTDDLVVPLRRFLNDNGFEVVNARGLQIPTNAEIARVPPYKSYQFAKEVFFEAGGADAVYIPCANWPVALNIDKLEKDLRVPVVASNQSKIWAALRQLEIREPIRGFGRLLEDCL